MRTARLLAAVLGVTLLGSGCATTDLSATTAVTPSLSSTRLAAELRLGYFANVTHAGAVYGVAEGVFAEELGGTALSAQTLNAGPAAVEALFGGALDAAFLGPGPAVNAFLKSGGESVRIVSGATSGGASLVVRPGIDAAEDLRGATLATPQTGNTQDIALRTWLAENGLPADERGAGATTVVAQESPLALSAFRSGEIDGAWVPEPWASRMVLEAGGEVLVDEAALWPDGRFATTVLVVRTEFLEQYPATVTALLRGHVASTEQIDADPVRARTVVNDALEELTGKALPQPTLDRAFEQIELTTDPLAGTLAEGARDAFATGLVQEGELDGIYDLRLIERLLGRDLDDAGLGTA